MHSAYDLPSSEISDAEKDTMFEPGDCALILKANGDVMPISTGFDNIGDLIAAVGTRVLTQAEQDLLENGRRLFALLMASQSPMIMTILYELADNPEVFDGGAVERLEQLKRPN